MSTTHSASRLFQIFSAKLVLEVFGGAGAIWGFSEVCTFRRPETQEFWRQVALIHGFIFFLRFCMQIKDFVGEMGGQKCTIDDQKSWTRFFQIFSAKIVLEVFGGGGAIWGFSEALTLRNAETVEFWRYNALVIASMFFARFLLQCSDYLTEMNGDRFILDLDRKSVVRLVQVFSAKIVLEVFGAAGAIWGFSEVLTLRRPETQELWRFIALIIGCIFFARFLLQMKDFVFESKYGSSSLKMDHSKWVRLFQIFAAKLVLEVFGGAGAIWGFSEALTLRNAETVEYWRFRALVIGFIFFIRWVLQIKDFLTEVKEEMYSTEKDFDKVVPMNETYQNGPVIDSIEVESESSEKSPLMV